MMGSREHPALPSLMRVTTISLSLRELGSLQRAMVSLIEEDQEEDRVLLMERMLGEKMIQTTLIRIKLPLMVKGLWVGLIPMERKASILRILLMEEVLMEEEGMMMMMALEGLEETADLEEMVVLEETEDQMEEMVVLEETEDQMEDSADQEDKTEVQMAPEDLGAQETQEDLAEQEVQEDIEDQTSALEDPVITTEDQTMDQTEEEVAQVARTVSAITPSILKARTTETAT
jgi:hypothetical protein